MNAKRYIEKLLDKFINHRKPWDATQDKIDRFKREIENPLREKLRNSNTKEELLDFCKYIDKIADTNVCESLIAQKFNWEYTGKYNTSVQLYSPCNNASRMWFAVNDIDWDEESQTVVINGIVQRMKGPYNIEFVDRKIFVNSKKDVYKAIEHLKFIKEQMKLQEMGKDFE